MIEITNATGWTISFDGRVLETFSTGNSRMHINGIKAIEVKAGKKGDLWIMVAGRWSGGITMNGFDPGKRSAIDELVAQVKAGITNAG